MERQLPEKKTKVTLAERINRKMNDLMHAIIENPEFAKATARDSFIPQQGRERRTAFEIMGHPYVVIWDVNSDVPAPTLTLSVLRDSQEIVKLSIASWKDRTQRKGKQNAGGYASLNEKTVNPDLIDLPTVLPELYPQEVS